MEPDPLRPNSAAADGRNRCARIKRPSDWGQKHVSDNRFNLIQFTNSMPATKSKLLGLVLLFAVFNSQALTLGRMRGVALVGQGLDVSIPVQLDPDEAATSRCFEADVFHADTRQDPNRVQLSLEPTQTAQNFNLRVLSSSLVDEPVVTVYLRSVCGQKTSRRYVLLADVVSDQLASAAPRATQVPLVTPASALASVATDAAPAGSVASAVAGVAAAAPMGAPAAIAPRRSRPAAAAKPAPAVSRARKPARPRTAVTAAPAMPSVDEKLRAGRSAGQSRLKLDPLEVLSERVTTLESSTASAPAELAARDARDAQRLQSLEASVRSLLTVATRNEASLLDMKARLQQAESERYQNSLVYGLVILLLLCLAGIAFLLTRRDRQSLDRGGNWWSGSASAPPAQESAQTVPVMARSSGFSPMSAPTPLVRQEPPLPEHEPPRPQTPQVAPRSMQAPITQVDGSLVEMSESTFDRLMQSGTTHNAVRKPRSAEAGQPASAGRRSINSEELFDIRQQAEFYVSLGQTDQAVRILENRISENGESSPLAYLDLLKIFHSLGLRADFRQVREDFNLLFNARVPEFSSFNDEGKDLEDYPDLLAGIAASWGTPAVFAAIEMWLFHDPGKTQRELLDLGAFRDLLLLHAVAQSASGPADSSFGGQGPVAGFSSAPVRPGYRDTRPNEGASRSGSASAQLPLPTLGGVPDLDIDLSDLHVSKPAATVPGRSPELGAAVAPKDAGNLIDFDLSDAQTDGLPRIGQ